MKRLALTLSLLLLPTMALTQTAGPLVPTGEVVLKVTLPEAEIIWSALRKLPVEQVELLMGKIRQQVSEQSQPKSPQAVNGELEK